MPAQLLYIHGIHTPSLRLRQPGLHQTIQSVRLAAQNAGYEVVPRLVLGPNTGEIAANLKTFEGRIDYSKTETFKELDDHIHTLNVQEISNLEKHRKAWEFAAAADPKSLHVILEDDATLHPVTNPEASLEAIFKESAAFDGMTALCTSKCLLWSSKEAYIITPSVARKLLDDTEKIKMNTRGHLSWWVAKNQSNVKFYRVTVDGSKLGLFPSSIHSQNHLIFNKDYKEMLEFVSAPVDDVQQTIRSAIPRFEAVLSKSLSPDFMHVLGVLHHRVNNPVRAKDLFLGAISELARQGGVISSSSEILINAISIHRFLQDDIKEVTKQPSKYTKMSPMPLLSSA